MKIRRPLRDRLREAAPCVLPLAGLALAAWGFLTGEAGAAAAGAAVLYVRLIGGEALRRVR